jgi:enterobactin synthetase component D
VNDLSSPYTWPHSVKIEGQCVPDSPFLLPSKIVQRVVNAPVQRIRLTELSEEPDKSKSDRLRRARVLTSGGRILAAELLSLLGAVDSIIGKSVDRAPLWPDGFTGSITHTNNLIGVAVCRSSEFQSVGIDIEEIVSAETAKQICSICLSHEEYALVQGSNVDYRVLVTICFSAKEALYKCVYPLTRIFFDFKDVRIICLDMERQLIRIQLLEKQSLEFPSGRTLDGRFSLHAAHVFTSFEIPQRMVIPNKVDDLP